MRRIPRLKRTVRHAPLPTRRTIRRRRSTSQTRYRRCVLVHGAGLLLRRHAGLSAGRRPTVRFLLRLVRLCLLRRRRLRLCVHGRRRLWLLGVLLGVWLLLGVLLLGVLRVGVLVVDGGLGCTGYVGRLGVLLHGDTLFLHCVDVESCEGAVRLCIRVSWIQWNQVRQTTTLCRQRTLAKS